MKREVKLDPFFSDQPPMKFVEELKKPLHSVSSMAPWMTNPKKKAVIRPPSG